MGFSWIASLVGSVYATGLAATAFWRAPKRPAHVSFGLGMAALAVESIVTGLMRDRNGALWQVAWLPCAVITAAPWLYFSFCYSRGDHKQVIRKWGPAIYISLAALAALMVVFRGQLIVPEESADGLSGGRRLAWAGVVVNLALVVASVTILANLERTFRDSVGIMRWRIKYVILGLGALFVFRLFRASQAVLYSSTTLALQSADAGVLILACGLISLGLARARLFDVDIYPSHAVLVRSFTVMLAGVYLVVVGILAQIVRLVGRDARLPLLAFVFLLALVGLAAALASERIRRRLNDFVTRNFRRPVHDYKRQWMTFAAETAPQMDGAQLCRTVVNWVAETFRALSVNIWLRDDRGKGFLVGASTCLNETVATRLGEGEWDWTALTQAMMACPGPVSIDASNQTWLTELRRLSPGIFSNASSHLCMPLIAGSEFLGLITVGDRVGNAPFSIEDRDLLNCVGVQTAAGLLKVTLSRKLLAAKELEAFQTMSAFFVHDLKNTASTLSLMLQNLRENFGNPEFRDDALRAVGKGVQHLDGLIAKLSEFRGDLSPNSVEADLGEVAKEAINKAGPMSQIQLLTDLKAGVRFRFDPEQIEKVILNLVLNARDAVIPRGEIRVRTAAQNGWAILSVADNGCGMPPDFVRHSLFRPFQTTKKRGVGIGMFQSKMIIEAHRGRIDVESAPGFGTAFHIMLPLV